MSSGYHFASDAALDFRRLEPELQEDILDELERLLSLQASTGEALQIGSSIHPFTGMTQGGSQGIALTLFFDPLSMRLTVLGIELLG